MKQTIYLVGQISPKYEITYSWRKFVREYFKHDENKYIIDPCANPFNKKGLEKKEYAVQREKRATGIDVLPAKDLTFVKRSDIAIVNMNQYDMSKPLLGSYFELAWYFMYPEKAVIAFADDLDDYQCKHPFVQQAVTVWCNNAEEACELVSEYFTSQEGI
jgi:nucleoside 2-deoxyribosyltransferase